MQPEIRITAVQRLCLQDGPGVRTTVFLKGCFLSCPWCCNPEAMRFNEDFLFHRNEALCGTSAVCGKCERKGGVRLLSDCPLGAVVGTFKDIAPKELHALLLRDKALYDDGGGVTFSGGEPLLQTDALAPLLAWLHRDGVKIAMETSLFAPHGNLLSVFPLIDDWIVDVKFQFGRLPESGDGGGQDDFMRNLRVLQSDSSSHVFFRMVVLPHADIYAQKIAKLFEICGVDRVELLPCHSLGAEKYRQLGLAVPDFGTPSFEEMRLLAQLLDGHGIKCTLREL